MPKHTTYDHIFLLENLQTEKILLTDALADSSLGIFILLGESDNLNKALLTLNRVRNILRSIPAQNMNLKDIQCFWIKDRSLLQDEALKTLIKGLLEKENRITDLTYDEADFEKIAAMALAPGSNKLCELLYHESISGIKVNSAGTKAILEALNAKKSPPEA